MSSVSVVIPAYNAAATILRALHSVLKQTRQADEILVIDDGSVDDTRQLVQSLARRRIKLLSLPIQSGAGKARNAGIEAASGDLVAFLDSDDEWLSSKLEKQIAMIESDSRLSVVACASRMISQEGIDLGDLYRNHPIVVGPDAWKALLESNFIATPSVLAWRRQLLELGGFDASLKIGEDQDLWIRLTLLGHLGFVPESLVRVHLRANSLGTWCLDDLLTFTLPMIDRHISELGNRLTKSEIRRIRGARLRRFGQVAYARGDLRAGLRLMGQSMLLGYRPFETAYYLASAAPPTTWLKRRLGYRDGS